MAFSCLNEIIRSIQIHLFDLLYFFQDFLISFLEGAHQHPNHEFPGGHAAKEDGKSGSGNDSFALESTPRHFEDWKIRRGGEIRCLGQPLIVD